MFQHLSETSPGALCKYGTASHFRELNAHHVSRVTRIPDIESCTNCLDFQLIIYTDHYTVVVDAPVGTSDDSLVKVISVNSPPDLDPFGIRRVWRYKLADRNKMRHFLKNERLKSFKKFCRPYG